MGLFSSLFGGSKQKSSSTSNSFNQAYDDVNENFSPLFGQAAQGVNSLQALLGGDTSGFDTFKQASGFNPMVEQGSRGITGNAAAGGMLRSGGTGKALMNYGNQMQNQFMNNYMDRLFQQANLGFNAGQLVTSAGARSDSNSTSSGNSSKGIGGLLGGIGSLAALSDIRLKENIVYLGTLKKGLNLYEYDYIGGPKKQIGVMAQEVEQIVPEALGPTVDGYLSVDYGKLKEVLNESVSA